MKLETILVILNSVTYFFEKRIEFCIFDSDKNKSIFIFDNVASGQEIENSITLTLFDQINQEVTSMSDRYDYF